MKALSRFIPSQLFAETPIVQGYIRGADQHLHRYMLALTYKDEVTKVIESLFNTWDALICPVTPGAAFKHSHTRNPLKSAISTNGIKVPYWNWGLSYTFIFSLTGHPVVTMPVGYTAQGLPIGIQLVGKRWGDYRLLAIAKTLSTLIGQYRTP